MTETDTLQRFLFDGIPARGAMVRLDGAWQQVVARHNYPAPVRQVLGQMVAACALLAANLKFEGTLIMQLHGKGDLRLAVAECTNDRTVRATARFNEDITDAGLPALLGEGGTCVLTLEPRDGDPWQGIVALEGDTVAEIIENYMQRSEQLETRLKLACNDEVSAGMLLQRLPDGHGDPEGWNEVAVLGETLRDDEMLGLGAQDILHRLFHELQVRVFEPQQLSFACNCSEERVGDMLKLLGGQEAAEVVIEQGSIEIACEYCGQRYVFDEDDVNRLFDFDVMTSVRESRH